MGWWSTDVMGGDTPLDIESVIVRSQESPVDFDYDKIINSFNEKNWVSDDWLKTDFANIFHQVLGVMMMGKGVAISNDLKEKMVLAALNDEWANDSDEDEDGKRRESMIHFITTLMQYEAGTPVVIGTVGLMEKILTGVTLSNDNVSVDTIRSLILANVEEYRHDNVNELLDRLIEAVKKNG